MINTVDYDLSLCRLDYLSRNRYDIVNIYYSILIIRYALYSVWKFGDGKFNREDNYCISRFLAKEEQGVSKRRSVREHRRAAGKRRTGVCDVRTNGARSIGTRRRPRRKTRTAKAVTSGPR